MTTNPNHHGYCPAQTDPATPCQCWQDTNPTPVEAALGTPTGVVWTLSLMTPADEIEVAYDNPATAQRALLALIDAYGGEDAGSWLEDGQQWEIEDADVTITLSEVRMVG